MTAIPNAADAPRTPPQYTPGLTGAASVIYIFARALHLVLIASALPLTIVYVWRKDLFHGVAGGFAIFGSLVWVLLYFTITTYSFPLRLRHVAGVVVSFAVSIALAALSSPDMLFYGAYQTVLSSLPAFCVFLAAASLYYFIRPFMKPTVPRAVPFWAFPAYAAMIAAMALLFLAIASPFFAEIKRGGVSALMQAAAFLIAMASYALPILSLVRAATDERGKERQSIYTSWAPFTVSAMLGSIFAAIIVLFLLTEVAKTVR